MIKIEINDLYIQSIAYDLMVYLNWKSSNGYTCRGIHITKIEGNAWLVYLHEKYPKYTHWISED